MRFNVEIENYFINNYISQSHCNIKKDSDCN